MPRPKSNAQKTSLYRLILPEGEDDLQSCIRAKYLEQEFNVTPIEVENIHAILVTGVISNDSPKWIPHVESLTGFRPDLTNNTSTAALLVPYEGYVYCLSWGLGHLIIDSSLVDSGFGMRFAIRKANANEVRSLTSHTLDTAARTARTTMPGGASIGAFGIEEIGEIVSRMVGQIPADGLTAASKKDDKLVTFRGGDGLSLPLGKEPNDLISDIRYLHDTVELMPPAEGLEHFEHTRPLLPGDPAIEALKNRLADALVPGASRLALGWPSEWEQEHGEAHSYRVRNLSGEVDGDYEELDLDDILEPLSHRSPEARLEALKRMTIIGLDSDGGAISRAIAGQKWITFETDLDGQRYIFHQGRWFNIGGAYLEMLRSKIDRIFARKSDITLPDWPREEKLKKGRVHVGRANEGRYNEYAPTRDDRFLCLDRKLIGTAQHPRGFEACDLLGPDEELIHVKRLDDSVAASHLFNQAIVSTEALRRQTDALAEFRRRVTSLSADRSINEDFRPSKVVLAFGGRSATPEALMTFSQVTLARCDQRIAEAEATLEILEIKDCDSVLPLQD